MVIYSQDWCSWVQASQWDPQQALRQPVIQLAYPTLPLFVFSPRPGPAPNQRTHNSLVDLPLLISCTKVLNKREPYECHHDCYKSKRKRSLEQNSQRPVTHEECPPPVRFDHGC